METPTPSFMNRGTAEEILTRLRIRLLQIVLVFLVISSGAFTFATIAGGGSLLNGTNAIAPLATLFSLGFLLLISRRQFILPITVAVIGYSMTISVFLFAFALDIGILFLLLSLTVITAAMLTNRFFFWLINVLTLLIIGTATLITVNASDSLITDNIAIAALITASFGLIPIAIGTVARYFIVTLERTLYRAQRSASLLAGSADIGRIVSEMLDLSELLDRAVEIIRDRFAFYHVSVFLLDDTERYAMLAASTGEVGERMLSRGHRLTVNAESVVGRSAQSQEIIITRDTDGDAGHSFNELLPYTRSEMAVPIMDNDGVVGVVDIQSRRTDAFTSTEIESLKVITNQLATAIRNARLFEDKERSIRENKRLFIEAETNLREIQRLNRQLTKQAWTDYLRTTRRVDGVTLTDREFANSAEWTPGMVDASRRRRAITDEQNGRRKVAVPIELRGEVIGAIELETGTESKKDDLVDMIRTVTQRLAVSLDNARLFEESNEATAQEQRVSEIVSRYPAADSVDELLKVTLEGLAETLGAEDASIRLGVIPDVQTVDEEDKPITHATRPEGFNPGKLNTNGGSSHDN